MLKAMRLIQNLVVFLELRRPNHQFSVSSYENLTNRCKLDLSFHVQVLDSIILKGQGTPY